MARYVITRIADADPNGKGCIALMSHDLEGGQHREGMQMEFTGLDGKKYVVDTLVYDDAYGVDEADKLNASG